MIDPASLAIFMTAALALLLMPGPVVLYLIASSIRQGRKAGLVSILGVLLASVCQIIFVIAGISAVLQQSPLVFSIIKYLGAAYLIYLGIKTFLSKTTITDVENAPLLTYAQFFRQGFIVNITNPKSTLFFLSFLPQFVDPSRGSAQVQILVLGFIFVGMASLSDSMYVMIAGTAGQLLAGNNRAAQAQKLLSGTIYVVLGIAAGISGSGFKL